MGHLHQVRVDVASGVDPLYAICVAIGSLKAARGVDGVGDLSWN
jgi:hypothetical protein